LVKKILFVCSGNIHRSPTAEAMFNGVKGIEAKSAGILPYSSTVISKELVDWADKIFVMEEHHKQHIIERWPYVEKKIVVLNIEDVYGRNSLELKKVLKEKEPIIFGSLGLQTDV